MKRLITSMLLAMFIMAGCATIQTNHQNSLNSPGVCSDMIAFENLRKEDEASFKAYVDMGCTFVGIGRSLLEDDVITIKSVDEHEIPVLCQNKRALACAYRFSENHYVIYNPHGHARYLPHEMLHVLFWEMGVPGDLHHTLMHAKGWY